MTHSHDHAHGDHAPEDHHHDDHAREDHDHDHAGHEHPHAHGRGERYADRRHPEFVVLDIGGEIGALILHTDSDLHGVEIEISPDGDDRSRSHKQVLERSIAGRPAFTAVYDGLREGAYTLWVADEPRARGVEIRGGEIAKLDWRVTAGARS